MKKKTHLIILLVVLGLLIVISLVGFHNNNKKDEVKQVCINEMCFEVEVADDDKERQIGLMNRDFLEEDKGMLFVFPESDIHSFWMKDTLISLDMIWINENGEIVFIKEYATPLSEEIISPNAEALYVLEVNGGSVERKGIEVGEGVEIN